MTRALGTVVLFICVAVIGCTAEMTWSFTNDRAALCNDFTRAGFFHRNATTNAANQKWVVFLESGSLCYSNETCNRRYFQSHLRERYSTEFRGRNIFGNFDTELAWSETGAAGQPLTEVVNPLMTSTSCFRNETSFFDDAEVFTVEGRDVLSTDFGENPTFCKHGHVLVPYCSSDLWLGSENATSRQYSSLMKEEPCDCFVQDCFRYDPTSTDLQFTFRGQTIFRSVLETLDSMYDLQRASEIVLVGSSAGGVGVLNSARWVREEFPNASIKVVTDSSWFINFRDGVNKEFGTVIRNSNVSTNSDSSIGALFDLLASNEACSDTRLGYPCCLSAECLLMEKSITTKEPYFPRDVPLFALTSVYDIFLLANALSGLVPVDGSGIGTASLALQFITTVGEYGGAMNASLIQTSTFASRSDMKFTYFASQCFQHVYLATSTLRQEEGLLGTNRTIVSRQTATFR